MGERDLSRFLGFDLRESLIVVIDPSVSIALDRKDESEVRRYRWRAWESSPGKIEIVSYIKDFSYRRVRLARFLLRPRGNLCAIQRVGFDRFDFRRCALMTCSTREFKLREGKIKSQATSRFKGVYLHSNLWRAQIVVDGKSICLGLHTTEEEAAVAYDKAAVFYFGPQAFLNIGK